MNLAAGILVIISAGFHAFWNYSSKQRGATGAYFFMAVATSTLALSPMLVVYRAVTPQLPASFWVLVVLTGFFEALYYISLTLAYQSGDLSLAYPLLRAIPVVLVALISFGIHDGREPHGIGWVGILLVASGCLFLPLVSFRNVRLASYLTVTCGFALMAALGTTGYSTVDDRALRILSGLDLGGAARITNALYYLEIQAISTLVFIVIYLMINRRERERLGQIFRVQAGQAVQTGLLVSATYALVLVAMSLATSVSYVVAFRQLSIPIGAIFGMVVQKEPRYSPRLLGIGLVFAGLIFVAVA